MRGDPSGKIIINKGILPNVNYEPTGKTMKLLTAADDGKGLETWILQVKTPEFAQKLAEVLEANKASWWSWVVDKFWFWRLCGRALYKIFQWLNRFRHYSLDFCMFISVQEGGKLYGDALCKMAAAWIWFGDFFVSSLKVSAWWTGMVWRCIAISSSYIDVKTLIMQSALIGSKHEHLLGCAFQTWLSICQCLSKCPCRPVKALVCLANTLAKSWTSETRIDTKMTQDSHYQLFDFRMHPLSTASQPSHPCHPSQNNFISTTLLKK